MAKKQFLISGVCIALLLLGLGFYFWPVGEQKRSDQPSNNQQIPQEVASQQEMSSQQALAPTYCTRERFEAKSYIVCRADPIKDDIRLFLNDAHGIPYKRFHPVNAMLAKQGEALAFAMNAGMYHDNYRAVGLYIEGGEQLHAIATRDGPGNFHLKPNGVFFIHKGKAGVLETDRYLASAIQPDFATQSGPMLVMDNALHPRFIPQSPFVHYRNAVGVNRMGEVFFVISETRVNFDEMARLFRDHLQVPDALFLDGSISSLYAPEMNRSDWWHAIGPMIGVVVKKAD